MDEALDNQFGAVSAAQAAIDEAHTPFPDAPDSPDDLVKLPGGLVKDSQIINTATVRELNGEHEERLAKALKSRNQFHFYTTLLECGTVKIGTQDATPEMLKDLLVGDRDQLLLAIRAITYGAEIDVPEWECPACGELSDIGLDITKDVPVVELKGDREFDVELRRGRIAKAHLLTGHDDAVVWADPELDNAQRSTLILQRGVTEILQPNGTTQSMVGWPSLARELSIPDRRTILEAIQERKPGPRYNEIKLTHDTCGKEVTLALSLGALFLV